MIELIKNFLTIIGAIIVVFSFGKRFGKKQGKEQSKNEQNTEALKNVEIAKKIREKTNGLSLDSIRAKLLQSFTRKDK